MGWLKLAMVGSYIYAGPRKAVTCSSFHYAPSPCGPIFTHTVDDLQCRQASMQAKFQILSIKNAYGSFTSARSSPKGHYGGTLQLVIDELLPKLDHLLSTGSSIEQIENEMILANSNEEHQMHDLDEGLHEEADNASSSAKSTKYMRDREIQRRRKIGLANRGRTPWNKGRKHNEVTRERIRKRTIEALSDPKVRKKMSEWSHSHSDQSKARISSALRKIWQERLAQRRLQENCYLMWARNIAEAAKLGCADQEGLDWDSYEKMKGDIISQHLQWKANKARAKEMKKLRAAEISAAERAAKIRAENASRLAQERKEKEKEKQEKAKAKGMKAMARKKSDDIEIKMVLSKDLKLKARLTKFHHHKKQMRSSVSIQKEVAEPRLIMENLDINLIKIEKMQRQVSLADQIQAVKNKKTEFSTTDRRHTFPFFSSENIEEDL